jgi:hypothetical protein
MCQRIHQGKIIGIHSLLVGWDVEVQIAWIFYKASSKVTLKEVDVAWVIYFANYNNTVSNKTALESHLLNI